MEGSKLWIIAATVLSLVVVIGVGLRSFPRSNHEIPDAASRFTNFSGNVLWAWERPEDLRFIDPKNTAVAYLAKTIHLRGDKALSQPRLQPVRLPENALRLAVVRIESDRQEIPTLSPAQQERTLAEIIDLTEINRLSGIQIDFDATVSERQFYRQLLFAVRAELPREMLLSITALASWCEGDNWLADLPIDEAVPMLFRLGLDRNQIRAKILSDETFTSARCRNSIGVSTDEPLTKLPRVQRVYIFNPSPWSAEGLNNFMDAYE